MRALAWRKCFPATNDHLGTNPSRHAPCLLRSASNRWQNWEETPMAEPAYDTHADEVPEEERQTEADSKRYVSERGPFAIWENPKLRPTFPPEAIDVDQAADGFEYGDLAAEFGEQPVRRKIGEMIQSYGHGTSTTPLFGQPGPNGMSLVHVWFGPNLPLFRHSHPRYGDCLYYVVAGEIHPRPAALGARLRVLRAERHAVQVQGGPGGRGSARVPAPAAATATRRA